MPARLDDELIRARLQGLPAVQVPLAAGWTDVTRRLARGAARDRRRGRAAGFAAAASIAALASFLGLRYAGNSASEEPGSGTPIAAVATVNGELAELQGRSRVLEEVLAGLPERPAVARAGIALPIDELQDQVQWIDHQLTLASATDGAAPASEQLWRERVATMNSLVQLRYLEAQRTAL